MRYTSLFLAVAFVGCAPTPEIDPEAPFEPEYLGIETRKLDNELVAFSLKMTGARQNADVQDYGECAAVQYALIRGYRFARHVRTNVMQKGGIWSGDAVYTISADMPPGIKTLDAELAVPKCAEAGIPTV